MSKLRVAAERLIDAPSEVVYRCLADFKNHHHRFLPPQFIDYKVEQGGYGAGTVVGFTSTLGGRRRQFRNKIEEPLPGQVLIERDQLSDLVTTTTVKAQNGGTLVRFETVWQSSKGFLGFLERLFAPRMMEKMYQDELARLESYAKLN